jgi:hypothetical protein
MVIKIKLPTLAIWSAYSLCLWFCWGYINNDGCPFPLTEEREFPKWITDNPATIEHGIPSHGGMKIRLLRSLTGCLVFCYTGMNVSDVPIYHTYIGQ